MLKKSFFFAKTAAVLWSFFDFLGIVLSHFLHNLQEKWRHHLSKKQFTNQKNKLDLLRSSLVFFFFKKRLHAKSKMLEVSILFSTSKKGDLKVPCFFAV